MPVVVYAEELGVSRETLYRALAVSNLSTIHIKAHIGTLSAYCGAVSAGCGAGAGITYLYGGGYEQIKHTLVNAMAITSGIICDNPTLLKIFKDNNVAIAADDVAHESRAFRTDASEEGDPMMALVEQFTNTDYDVLLYDPQSSKNRRGEFVANMVKESGAQGLVLFMQQFCDPEEMELSLIHI